MIDAQDGRTDDGRPRQRPRGVPPLVTDPNARVIFCSEVSPSPRGPGWTEGCCDSCHDDEEDFGGYLCEGEYKGRAYRLCCSQMVKLEDKGLPDPGMES